MLRAGGCCLRSNIMNPLHRPLPGPTILHTNNDFCVLCPLPPSPGHHRYSEARGYPYSSEDTSAGHFTQMVWKSTMHLGCGVASCGGSPLYVCSYSPGIHMLHGHRPAQACMQGGWGASERMPIHVTPALACLWWTHACLQHSHQCLHHPPPPQTPPAAGNYVGHFRENVLAPTGGSALDTQQ